MSNKIITKSGDQVSINAFRNQVFFETEGDIVFMSADEAMSIAAALVSAANEANNQLGSAQV
jgi:hypothetical protein